nr:hypothetical protein BaRGS_032113 [Batillaria attramentaria]
MDLRLYARLVTAVKELKAEYPNHLVLDAGDQYQGTLWFYKYGGNVTSHFMNWLGYDAMTLGNHEFDRGPEGLLPFLEKVNFSVVDCNVDGSLVPHFMDHINKSVVLTVDGQKIGVVGYTTQDTPGISAPGDVKFKDVMTSVRDEVKVLADKGINKIIALGHAGYTMDKQVAKIPGVDVVVGGHSHTFLYTPEDGTYPSIEEPEGPYPTVVTQEDDVEVLVVQDYTMAKYLGVIHVTFDDEGHVKSYSGHPMLLNGSVAQDNATLKELEPWKAGVLAETKQEVGETWVHLEGDRTVCRRKECNMGNLIADAMIFDNLRQHDNESWNDVSIAIMNSGGIRNSIEPGKITIADVLHVQPFQNTIVVIQIKGEHLRAALEHSVAGYNPCDRTNLPGAFLQFSGMRVQYDMRKPAGKRVVSALVLCTQCLVPKFVPLDDSAVYKVVLPSFTADGGDDYGVIKNNIVHEDKFDSLDSDVLVNYVKHEEKIIQGLEGRIVFVDNSDECRVAQTPRRSTANSADRNVMQLSVLMLAVVMSSLF